MSYSMHLRCTTKHPPLHKELRRLLLKSINDIGYLSIINSNHSSAQAHPHSTQH
jgi:hypothetical protein